MNTKVAIIYSDDAAVAPPEHQPPSELKHKNMITGK